MYKPGFLLRTCFWPTPFHSLSVFRSRQHFLSSLISQWSSISISLYLEIQRWFQWSLLSLFMPPFLPQITFTPPYNGSGKFPCQLIFTCGCRKSRDLQQQHHYHHQNKLVCVQHLSVQQSPRHSMRNPLFNVYRNIKCRRGYYRLVLESEAEAQQGQFA